MKSGVPILPDEIAEQRLKDIPPGVIDSFNKLIAQDFNGSRAVVDQEKVVNLIEETCQVKRHVIFDNKWLDVEEIYRKTGQWKVEYDKPAWCESYPATFTFIKISK